MIDRVMHGPGPDYWQWQCLQLPPDGPAPAVPDTWLPGPFTGPLVHPLVSRILSGEGGARCFGADVAHAENADLRVHVAYASFLAADRPHAASVYVYEPGTRRVLYVDFRQ